MARPEMYMLTPSASEASAVFLCRCCFGVLACEGRVAGDPTAPALLAENFAAMAPLDHRSAATCDACASLRTFEEKRSRLAAPPERIGIDTPHATPKMLPR